MATKKVAIIGAGSSGLAAIKCCLEEGLEPVCIEKLTTIGGLWHYRSENIHGVPSVMKTTIINTSKEMSAYSDFPPPKEFANFMHNSNLLKYFTDYMKTNDLEKYIKFNQEVLRVERFGQSIPARWRVIYQDKSSMQTSEDIFDGVLVCAGHHAFPHDTKLPGMSDFKGEIIHSHDLKNNNGYEGKTVVVVGIGNSAVDVVIELSIVAKKVYLSTRRGAWTIARVGKNGLPFDFYITRFNAMLFKYLPSWYIQESREREINRRFDHALYGLKPKHSPFAQHPTISDDLPCRIISGKVVVKPDIKIITENSIIFEDDTCEENIDVIALCTGYEIKFPFIEDGVIPVIKNEVSLYKNIYSPNQEFSTLALIGLIQPIGAIFPIAEMQCRWATRIIKGDMKLPESAVMKEDVRVKKALLKTRYVDSPRHTIQVDFVPYMDELASIIGVKPNIIQLIIGDPALGLKCLFGPCVPYQYRLNGPNKWAGAREAIMSVPYRAFYPLKTRDVPTSLSDYVSYLLSLVIIVFLAIVIFK